MREIKWARRSQINHQSINLFAYFITYYEWGIQYADYLQ